MYGSVMLEFLVLAHRHCERSAARQTSSVLYQACITTACCLTVMAPNPKARLLKTIVLK